MKNKKVLMMKITWKRQRKNLKIQILYIKRKLRNKKEFWIRQLTKMNRELEKNKRN